MSTSDRLIIVGYVILCIASITACFFPMAGLPIGVIGGTLFLYGSKQGTRT